MSETDEIVRIPRDRRPAREVERDEPAGRSVVIESGPDHESPEDVLVETRRLLQESDRAGATARQQQRAAEERARQAETVAAQATATHTAGRQQTVASAIDQAKSEKTMALAAYKMAREAGDVEAEMQATDALSQANIRLSRATEEAEWLKNQPKPTAPQQTGNQPSAAAQQWIAAHPDFNTAGPYRRAALGAHSEALEAGHRDGSQEYIDYIDKAMAEEFGDGHGQGNSRRQTREEPVRERDRQPGRGDAAPPSRSTPAGNAGWKTVETDLGTILYQDRRDGTRGIRFGNAAAQERYEEAAQMTHSRKWENATPKQRGDMLADTVQEYITEDQEGGGSIKIGDGRKFG